MVSRTEKYLNGACQSLISIVVNFMLEAQVHKYHVTAVPKIAHSFPIHMQFCSMSSEKQEGQSWPHLHCSVFGKERFLLGESDIPLLTTLSFSAIGLIGVLCETTFCLNFYFLSFFKFSRFTCTCKTGIKIYLQTDNILFRDHLLSPIFNVILSNFDWCWRLPRLWKWAAELQTDSQALRLWLNRLQSVKVQIWGSNGGSRTTLSSTD